jgi:cell pole-organizing protein PopZ
MSKPDPAGGSLENILASIRKSLSEQSTDALSESAAAPVDQDKHARPSRRLTQRLAGTTADAMAPHGAQAGEDISDLLEQGQGPSIAAARAASAPTVSEEPAPPAAPGENDPLWFLTRRDEPAEAGELPPIGVAPISADGGVAAPPATEATLTRPEVLRASMPPFFGSSTESAVQPASGLQATQGAAPAAQAGADAAMAREVSLLAAAAEAAATRPLQAPPPQPALNGKGPAAAVPSPDTALTGDTPLTRALEVMVLDLLKPMLRQWLDVNMPRLVAEALEEEVRRTRAAKGDAKKT